MNKISAFMLGALMIGLAGCGFRYATHRHDETVNRHHEYAKEDPDVRGRREEAQEEAFDPVAQWTIRQDGYVFRFEADPQEPAWDEKVVLKLAISSASKDGEAPVTNAQMTCRAIHTSHSAMRGTIHNYKTHETHTQIEPGVYAMPILFGVGGTWRVDYQVDLPGWKSVKVSFPLKVRRSGNPVQEFKQMQPTPAKPADWK